MGESTRNEELAMVFGSEFDGYVLAECGRALADVDRDIEHMAADTPDELCLGMRGTLEMKSTHDASGRHGLIILHEVDMMPDGFIEETFAIAFEEITPCIGEYARFDYKNTLQGCFNYFHFFG